MKSDLNSQARFSELTAGGSPRQPDRMMILRQLRDPRMDPVKGASENMITVTTDFVPGREIVEAVGVVRGNTIRAKHVGKDIMAALRMLVGGEVKEYTSLLSEARNESMRRMEAQAEKLGADAVINLRFMTSQVVGGAAEMLAYGTAVKYK